MSQSSTSSSKHVTYEVEYTAIKAKYAMIAQGSAAVVSFIRVAIATIPAVNAPLTMIIQWAGTRKHMAEQAASRGPEIPTRVTHIITLYTSCIGVFKLPKDDGRKST